MMSKKGSFNVRYLVESALMLAAATVLSLIVFPGPWALGGGITVCSMLPLVVISQRYGAGRGVFTAFVFGLIQMLLGLKNVQYASSVLMAAAIILLDYLLAFSVIGLSCIFRGKFKSRVTDIVVGIVFTFFLRFVFHFLSGVMIWEVLWPNELGWAPAIWSFAYNGSYMLPEIIITAAAAALLYKPLKKYFEPVL